MPRLLGVALSLLLLLTTRGAWAQQEQQVVPPSLLHFEEAPHPEREDTSEDQGETVVVLRLDINEQGAVTHVEVVESGGIEFDERASTAAQKFRFKPATRAGETIPVRILFRYVFTPPQREPIAPVKNLAGSVYHRWDKTPLAGVKVTIVELGLSATTDEAGRFEFVDVPSGQVSISFEGDGLVSATLEQRIAEGKLYDLRVGLEPHEEELAELEEEIDDVGVVRASRVRAEVVESKVERAQGERVAGAQGDVVKVVHSLGGVGRSAAGASSLVVWGAAPSETRLYVDWIPVPSLFHTGGARSILPSDFVGSLTLVPGGFGVAWGRAIGGLVRVDTVPVADEREFEARASVDFIDAGLGTRGWTLSETWTSASARHSLLRHTLDAAAPDRSRELVPVADYWDYQFKTVHRVSANETLEVVVLGSDDRVERGIPSVTPDDAFLEDASSSFHRVGARLERVSDSGATTRLASWLGFDETSKEQTYGGVSATDEEDVFGAGLRLEEVRRLRPYLELTYGLDLEYTRTANARGGALSLPAREGDVTVFGQPPGNRINSDEWIVATAGFAGYAAALFEIADGALDLEPGVRLEPTVVNGDRVLPVRPTEPPVGYTELRFAVDPRFRVTWSPVEEISVYAAAGQYHQVAAPKDMSPVFGNPTLKQPVAHHLLAGANFSADEWLQLEVTGFWTFQQHLTVRSPNATPAVAQLLVSTGQGRNYGAQTAIRTRLSKQAFAWATYSLMRAERRADGDLPWRLFDADQTHVGQLIASWAEEQGLELGASFQVSSGFPRTPVEDAVYNTASGDYDPIFGEQNSRRLPTFFQTSLRVGWRQTASWGRFRTWLDVQNVTNHGNAEEIVYTADYRRSAFVEGLPILPILGMEVNL